MCDSGLKNKLVGAKEEKRAQLIKELKCFWTWPWRHIWDGQSGSYERICVICKKSSLRGNYDASWYYDLADKDGKIGLRAQIALKKKKRKLKLN